MFARRGYFDESERHEGGEPIAVAGYLFKEASYKRFCHDWRRNVLRHGTHRFSHSHMTDLVSGHQEYRGLSITDRVAILDRAVNAITTHSFASTAVYFNQAEFEEVAPVEWAKAFGSIYGAACHFTVQVIGYWLDQWKFPHDVIYVFERGHKFQAQVETMLNAVGVSEILCVGRD